MSAIVIKEIEKKDFYEAKDLLKSGLFEHSFEVFKFTTTKSTTVQGFFVGFALLISWLMMFTWINFVIVLLLIEFGAYRFIKYQWNAIMSTEMCEMETWKTFCKTYDQDDGNRFWVAVEKNSGHIVGTVSVVIFGNYKTVKGCGAEVSFDSNDIMSSNTSNTIQRHISVELKRLTVSPSFRGTGLSQRLMNQADEYVKSLREKNVNVSKVVLFVNLVQKKAKRLYERNDFKISKSWDLPMYFGLSSRVLCFYEKRL